MDLIRRLPSDALTEPLSDWQWIPEAAGKSPLATYEAGLAPGDGEVLAFKVPAVLGGPLEPDDLEVGDLGVALSVAGQIIGRSRTCRPGRRSPASRSTASEFDRDKSGRTATIGA